MNVIFRTDASIDIGTGHVMRCLTLAKALREQGVACRFVCREHEGNLIDLIRQCGFDVQVLPVQDSSQQVPVNEAPLAHNAWLGADWQMDAELTKKALADDVFDWMVVDHYALDARWQRQLKSSYRKLMVIDDIADRPHECDFLLDQNFGRTAQDYAGLVPEDCQVLVGPQYALLRPEFSELRQYSLARRADPYLKHLLINMGGVDKDNVTGKVLGVIRDCSLPDDLRITIVMGPHAPWLEQVRYQAKELSVPTDVLVSVENMAQLMADCDFSIGAAGSTTWERCCLGLPTLLMSIAKNQNENLYALDVAGAVRKFSDMDELNLLFTDTLNKSKHWLTKMQSAAAGVCDGEGSKKVAFNMLQSLKLDIQLKILVTSSSGKIPLIKAVQIAANKFKPGSVVVAGDISKNVLSRYMCEEFWNMPQVNDENVDDILKGCLSRGIKVILPTRDGELIFWSRHFNLFKKNGISVLISSGESLERCLDKLEFSKYGQDNNLPIIPSSTNIDHINSQLYVVKERFGSGSKSIGIALDRNSAIAHAALLHEPIFQPYICGAEFSVDAWVSQSKIIKGLVLRKRDIVINGESQVTSTFTNVDLEKKIKSIVKMLGLTGHVVLQAINTNDGKFHVIECNARFGGASTASIKVGLDSLYWSICEIYESDINSKPFERLDGEIRQVRVPMDFYV